MAFIGKGRGRGFPAIKETTLRRPGQPFPSKSDDLTHCINKFIIKDVISDAEIDSIAQTINDLSKDNSMKDIFHKLYKMALDDREFGIKLAIICSNSKVYSINNSELRTVLLSVLQKDYEEREKIKAQSIVNFRNAISFFGEVYNSLKLNGPLQFLATPLLHYFEMLLENLEEDDLELLIIQISINGRKIYEDFATLLIDFMLKVRTVLIHQNLSLKCRTMLLYIIDLANQRFIPLSGKLQEFYVDSLGINTFVNIQRNNKDLTIDTDTKNDTNDQDILLNDKSENNLVESDTRQNNDSILMKAPVY